MSVPDPRDAFALDGRTAIVTGGSRGLGRAMAVGLARCGASVVVTSRDLSSCEEVVSEIVAAGGTAHAVGADVGDLSSHHRITEETVERFGRIDVLINNAGVTKPVLVEHVSEAAYDWAHGVNAKGPLFLTQAAYPHLVASGHGSVINMLSVGIWNAHEHMVLYRSTKLALQGMTMVMAKEWGPSGVRVNAVAPGTFATDMVTENLDAEAQERAKAFTPQRRIADPSEIVPTILYLASDASSFVTGTVLRIDGGMISQ